MKSIWVLSMLAILGAGIQPAQACDVCGCMPISVGTQWPGMQNRHMLSLEGRWLGFTNSDGQSQASDRLYQLILSGRLAISDRFKITASVPYSGLSRKIGKNNQEAINGLSDISMLAELQVLSMQDSLSQLWLGLGLKAPTGEFRSSINSFYLPPNFQLGTGTWDGLASITYRLQKDKWAWDGNVTGRMGGENKQAFAMPWLMIAQANARRVIQKKSHKIVIGIGSQAEFFGPTKSIGIPIEESGFGFLGTVSAGYQTKNYALGFQLKQPLAQSYGGGNTIAKQRLSCRLSFVL